MCEIGETIGRMWPEREHFLKKLLFTLSSCPEQESKA